MARQKTDAPVRCLVAALCVEFVCNETPPCSLLQGAPGTERVDHSRPDSDAVQLSPAALYARLEQAESLLSVERQEKARLSTYLTQVFKEVCERSATLFEQVLDAVVTHTLQIELKTPVIEQQRRDYERALLSHEQLSTRLEYAMRDCNDKETEIKLLSSKVSELSADRDILRQEVQDLSTQIRMLLAEHARVTKGTSFEMSGDAASIFAVPSTSLVDEVKSLAALDPDDVISHNLVSFKDLTELQTRNVQLLRVVRQLSKQRSEELARSAAEAEAAAAAGLKVCVCPAWPKL